MKKLFNSKAIVLVLSLVLIFSAMAFIISANEEAPSPDIVKYNVYYSDTFKLMVAVEDANIPAGATASVKVYNEAPTATSTAIDQFSLTRTSIDQFDGAYFYTGTTNRSVSAAAMATEFYMQAEYTLDGKVVKGNVVKYSVAEYLYEKLYLQDFVSKTEEDGDDYIRKTFYEGILAFGVGAQHLVLETKPQFFMDELSYCIVDNGTVNRKATLLANPETELTIAYTGTNSINLLYSWNYIGLESGENTEYLVDADKTLTLAAPSEAFKLVPVFKNPYLVNFENNSVVDEGGSLTNSSSPTNATHGIVANPKDATDSVYQVVGTPSGNTHLRYTFAEGNDTGNTFTLEVDMYISSTVNGATVPDTSNLVCIDFRLPNLYQINLNYNANSDGVNVQSNVKDENGNYNNFAALPVDRWFTFKMVVVTSEVNGVVSVDSDIYVDGDRVGGQSGITKFGSSSLTSSSLDATTVNFKFIGNVPVNMYLDDLSFTRTESAE